MGKTIYISDKDALDVDRVIVSSTGMEYKLLYSCDEIDNYENRLKADLVAILEELDLQIDELYFPQTYPEYMEGRSDCLEEIKELIQQKINALKEA